MNNKFLESIEDEYVREDYRKFMKELGAEIQAAGDISTEELINRFFVIKKMCPRKSPDKIPYNKFVGWIVCDYERLYFLHPRTKPLLEFAQTENETEKFRDFLRHLEINT